MEDTLRTHLLELVRLYSAATQTSRAAIGKRALNDNRFFARLAAGRFGFTVRTYDRLILWFADRWPEQTPWPAEIPRREPVKAAVDSADAPK